MDPAHGPPLQARVAAANGTVIAACKLLALTQILAHMDMIRASNKSKMNWTGAKQLNGGKNLRRQWAWQAKNGRQTESLLNKALQATQPADSPPGTGLEEQTAHSWPASQQKQQLPTMMAASSRAVQVGGGSAKLLTLRKAGADLPNLSLPHLSPLPVTVPTHSLNLYKPNLAPN